MRLTVFIQFLVFTHLYRLIKFLVCCRLKFQCRNFYSVVYLQIYIILYFLNLKAAPFIARQMVLRFSHKSFTQTVCQQQKGYKVAYTSLRIRKRGRCKRTLRKKIFEKHSKRNQNDLESCHNERQISITEDNSLFKDNLSSLTSTFAASSSVILCTDETMTTAEATTAGSSATTTDTVKTTTTDVSATTNVIASTSNSCNATTDKNTVELTESKRKLLVQIHSILKAFERKKYNSSNAYVLSTNIWSRRMKATEVSVIIILCVTT